MGVTSRAEFVMEMEAFRPGCAMTMGVSWCGDRRRWGEEEVSA